MQECIYSHSHLITQYSTKTIFIPSPYAKPYLVYFSHNSLLVSPSSETQHIIYNITQYNCVIIGHYINIPFIITNLFSRFITSIIHEYNIPHIPWHIQPHISLYTYLNMNITRTRPNPCYFHLAYYTNIILIVFTKQY